jgi:hypothetical protein
MARIRWLERNDIEDTKWDHCVERSPHGDVYALSGYLDIMAKQWSGLVQDDYAAVLPIPWNRKYGIPYVYTPRFIGALPLCGDPANTLPLADFLAVIPGRFFSWDLDISTDPIAQKIPHAHRLRNSHVLDLQPTYESLFGRFRSSYRNLVRQCGRKGYTAGLYEDHAGIISLAAHKKEIPGMKRDDYRRFEELCTWLSGRKMLEVWETLSPGGQRCAGAIFAITGRKIYYLLAWNNDEGRRVGASHVLMDRVIAKHAATNLVMDFEGSEVPEIAYFLEGFGGHIHPSLFVRHSILQPRKQ